MGIREFFKRIAEKLDEQTIVEDYEAKLYPMDGGRRKVAELEYVKTKAGQSMFEAEIESSSGIPVGDEAVVLIHGVEVCRLTIRGGGDTELLLRTNKGDEVPPIQLGDEAELAHQGQVIAKGVFQVDD